MTKITNSKSNGSKGHDKFKDCTTHFFVTVVETHKDNFTKPKDGSWAVKCTRCWGYTDTFEQAEKDVLDNYTDMRECSYQWVIIEEHVMDTFAMPTGRFQWYHWNQMTQSYEKCRQPAWSKGVCSWGIG